MSALSVVVTEDDPNVASLLLSSLEEHFGAPRLAGSLTELESSLPQEPVDVVIADLETIRLRDVTHITHELGVPVICVHRIPDEDMWTAALQAGALDICLRTDARAIVDAVQNYMRAGAITAA